MRKCVSQKYAYKLDTFFREDGLSYYLLGAWITDGSIHATKNRPNRKYTTLTSKDKDWLEIINDHVCPEKSLLKHGENCFRIAYYSTKLSDWFISHQCTPNKSLTLEVPIMPTKYLVDFLRGCWDGDGSLSFKPAGKKRQYYACAANLTSGSKTFCEGVANALCSFEIKCRVIPHIVKERRIEGRTLKAGNSWRVVVSSSQCTYNLCKLLYGSKSISMPRKQKIADSIIAYWERPFYCSDCGVEMNLANNQRNKERCDKCQVLHRRKMQRARYAASKLQS